MPLPKCIQWQYHNGIPVGKGKPIVLTSVEIDDISFWLSYISGSEVSMECVPVGAILYKKLLKSNEVHDATVYHIGESVAIQKYSDDSLEWIVEISKIVSLGPYEGNFYTFLIGKHFKPKIQNRKLLTDSWTGQSMLIPQSYSRLCIQPKLFY